MAFPYTDVVAFLCFGGGRGRREVAVVSVDARERFF